MNVKILNIRPVEGRRVTMLDSREILTRPASVQESPFWLRRLADGDVELDDTPEAEIPAPPPASANRKKEG